MTQFVRIGRIILLIPVWTFQYLIWIPLVIIGRFIRAALKLGAISLLLFLPVFGWLYLFTRMQHQHDEKMVALMSPYAPLQIEAAPPQSLLHPWFT